jgi:zinc protease
MTKGWAAAALALSVWVGSGAGLAQNLVASSTPTLEQVRSIEGITEYRLANGLRVLLFPDA